MKAVSLTRDAYVDFLRAFGLLMLVVAHTWAPEWMISVRNFDVPLMVFISAMCYKPLRGGYLAYFAKRVKRIYGPVFVFLSLFFLAEVLCFWGIGKPKIELKTVVGSYLLLNSPSIGYVWIMRVFLMMALLLPLLHKWLKNAGFWTVGIVVSGIIGVQPFMIGAVDAVDNKIMRLILDETVLYALGYSAIAILGLKIRDFSRREVIAVVFVSLTFIIGFVWYDGMHFRPQFYKYPPQSLYLLYGIFGSAVMWGLKTLLAPVMTWSFFTYLSENSMWIYLWHIIPVYAIARWAEVSNMWFGRYCVVLGAALLLNWGYHHILKIVKSIVR